MANGKKVEVLKPEHLQLIKETLAMTQPIPGECDRAEQLGVNCDAYRQAYAGATEWLKLAAKLYFPKEKLP
jgi:hypothetical protein